MWDCSLGGMAHGWRVGVGGAEGKEVCGGKLFTCQARIIIRLICQREKQNIGGKGKIMLSFFLRYCCKGPVACDCELGFQQWGDSR